MSIQVRSSTPRLNPLAGLMAPDPVPGDDAPLVTAPEAGVGDRLQLSPATQLAVAAKATAEASQAKEPQATPETKQPETAKADAQAKSAPVAPAKKSLMNFPPYFASIMPLTAQRTAVETALGGTAATINLGGMVVPLSIAKLPNTPEGHEHLQVTVGATSIEVAVAPELDMKELLPRLVDAYSKVPEHLRGSLKKVVLQTATNPVDAYWAKEFGSTQFASGASAGAGLMTFWKLKDQTHNLSLSTFNHEMGHLIGELYASSATQFATHAPPGWMEAAKADDDRVSDYAANNPDEDFAETWSYYMYARTDAEAMDVMRQRFPKRLEILDAIFRNELERKPEKAASRRSRARHA